MMVAEMVSQRCYDKREVVGMGLVLLDRIRTSRFLQAEYFYRMIHDVSAISDLVLKGRTDH